MVKRKRASTRKKITNTTQTTIPVQSVKGEAASSYRRFGGFIIDYLLLGIPNSVVLWVLKDNGLYTPIASLYNTFFAAIVLFYFIFLTWKNNGQTIGMQIVGTKVVGWRGKLKTSQIIVRFFVLFLLIQFPAVYHLLTGTEIGIWFLFLNALAILLVLILLIIDDEHRGVHDLIAGTWVIKQSQKSNLK